MRHLVLRDTGTVTSQIETTRDMYYGTRHSHNGFIPSEHSHLDLDFDFNFDIDQPTSNMDN